MKNFIFNELDFIKSIESKYVTNYGAEIGEVFCHIFSRNTQLNPIDDFFLTAKQYTFFNPEKFDSNYFSESDISDSKNAMISSIIKETKYNEHFMNWTEGEEYLNSFLNEFDEIEKVFVNANWTKSTSKDSFENELDLVGYSGISNYYYDYGFIIVTKQKIGILWFGDES